MQRSDLPSDSFPKAAAFGQATEDVILFEADAQELMQDALQMSSLVARTIRSIKGLSSS